MVTATIDRFDTDASGRRLAVLVLEDEQQLVVPAEGLPQQARRGDVVRLEFTLLPGEGQARAQRVADLQRKLFGE